MNKMERYPHIVQDPETCFGQPCIKGTRIRVLDIAIEYERMGRSPGQIAEAHPGLSLAQVHAALTYYYEHVEEIDRAIRAERKLVEQVRLATG
jgi:uncharacterized protein (DUF433 family)